MFTGIVSDIGEVLSVEQSGDLRARIGTVYDPEGIDLGASIACDGICLTVIAKGTAPRNWFDVQISAETISKTNLGATPWTVGRKLNLERALKVGDELGGHIVSGHVDATAEVVGLRPEGDSLRLTFRAPADLAGFIAPKGSVTLNGTSLTVNEVNGREFGVNLIPHTQAVTTWGGVQQGDLVNLEIDTLARYVARAIMLPVDKLELILQRFGFLEARLSAGAEPAEIAAISREYSELKPVVTSILDWKATQSQILEAEALLADPDMKALAEEELPALRAKLPELEQALRLALLPKDAADARPAIIEIRPGTGGDEAALFAGELLRMYQRYAEAQGWNFQILELSQSDLGGVKEAMARVEGEGVFARLKFESGVHRVQRVPETESGGRIHTSAATVAVLPEAEDVDIDIPAADIRIDTMRSSGAGGQHVNTTDSAVRITHLPTGIVVTSSEKSQHQNRANAMAVLRARLYDLERQAKDQARAADRKAQVGSGDRSERIRTYNFPQGRMTDHRINLTLYRLEAIMQGDLTEIVSALVAADQAARLAEMEG